MADVLIDWMLRMSAADANKELLSLAGALKDVGEEMSDLDKQANAAKFSGFASTLGWATQASPALGKVLEELASVQKSAFGVEAAMQLASRSSAGFEDLAEELRVINQLFQDGKLGAQQAQMAFGEVGIRGRRRSGDAAQLADDNERAEETYWRQVDRMRAEEAAKAEADARRLSRLNEDNANKEESHWARIDKEKEDSARRQANALAEVEKKRKESVQQAIKDLKSVGGWGVGLATAAVGMSARAGFQDTLQGQQSQAYQQLLNRQVASIFAPLVEEKTKYTAQFTTWLQGLNEPQKQSIRSMAVFAVSATTMSFVVPKVTQALFTLAASAQLAARSQALAAGASGGSLAAGAMGSAGVVGALAGPIGMAITAGLSLLASTPQGRESMVEVVKSLEPLFNGLADAVKELTPAIDGLAVVLKELPLKEIGKAIGWVTRFAAMDPTSGLNLLGRMGGRNPSNQQGGSGMLTGLPKGFEEIEMAYTRISEAAVKIDLQQQTVSELKDANIVLNHIANLLANSDTYGTSGGAEYGPGLDW